MTSPVNNYQEIVKKNGFAVSNEKEKRLGYLEWDEYFMAMTFLELRKGTHKSDAAIILNPRKIIISMASSTVRADSNEHNKDLDASYINHPEYKALCKNQEGTVMYTTTFPCEKCAETIIEAGISEIIYYRDSLNSDKTKELLERFGVTYRQFVSKKKKIEIDFSEFCDD